MLSWSLAIKYEYRADFWAKKGHLVDKCTCGVVFIHRYCTCGVVFIHRYSTCGVVFIHRYWYLWGSFYSQVQYL